MNAARIVVTCAASLVCILLATRIGDLRDFIGHRYVDGYHLHQRVDQAYEDVVPTQVTTFHARHWYATAALWSLQIGAVMLLFAAPFAVWRVLRLR